MSEYKFGVISLITDSELKKLNKIGNYFHSQSKVKNTVEITRKNATKEMSTK